MFIWIWYKHTSGSGEAFSYQFSSGLPTDKLTGMFNLDEKEISPVESEVNKELLEDHSGERSGWYYVGNGKYLLPSRYASEFKQFYHFPGRKDDIWISTFPRSGTTLMQELVWILVNGFDFETARKLNLWERTPFFELNLFFHEKTKEMFLEENAENPENIKIIQGMSTPAYHSASGLPSPRIIKTHFPLSLLPRDVHKNKAKVIYVARNPKDVIPSYYHLLRLWRTSGYTSNLKKFWEQFKKGHVPWGPYWSHLDEAWNHKNDENILFLFYEDMLKDMEAAIITIANFLSINVSLEKVKQLKEHLDIKNFCTNPAVNFEEFRNIGVLSKHEKSFVRKGEKRERSEELTDEMEREIDSWIHENYKKTTLRFTIKQ